MSKAAFYKAAKRKTKNVDVDGFGVLTLKSLTSADYIEWSQLDEAATNEVKSAFLVARCAYEKDKLLFKPDEYKKMASDIDSMLLLQLGNDIMVLSGLIEDHSKN